MNLGKTGKAEPDTKTPLVSRLIHSLRTLLRRPLAFVLVALVFLLLGLWMGGDGQPEARALQPGDGHEHKESQTTYTCSMHPQIKLPQPGKCPICYMDLVPVPEMGDDEQPRQLRMSEVAKKLASVRTAPVERRSVQRPVRMVGTVDYDETRLATIASWVNGRIQRLYVDFTGISVRKGDHMVRLYSPELRATQQELVTAQRANSQRLVRAAEERLRLWGLMPGQISRIRKEGKVSDHVTIYAPLGGVVIHKNGIQGMYVKPGTRIYTIADLSVVWVHLDAYESDLPWLRYGQEVRIEVEELGEKISGKVSFIDPFLDVNKRTAQVRVVVDNKNGRLRPGMYVRGTVQAELVAEGSVLAPSLEGKWICPMHPDIVKSHPGRCDVCSMPLEKPETIGLVEPSLEQTQPPTVIPASAPLITGKRAVVYVQVPDAPQPTYEGREIVLGPRAGDVYVVRSGLSEGELVVVEGNFKIDSAMQILARPSMMNPQPGEDPPSGQEPAPARKFEAPRAFLDRLLEFTDAYLALQRSLADDDPAGALTAAKTLPELLNQIDMLTLQPDPRARWLTHLGSLQSQVLIAGRAESLSDLRSALSPLSNTLITVIEEFGNQAGRSFYRHHCPMAFDNRGAWWLQDHEQVRNPYFGASMLRCADVSELLQGQVGGDVP